MEDIWYHYGDERRNLAFGSEEAYSRHIQYDTNLEILLTKSVGIGEHSDITSEVEQWVKKIGEAKEAVSVIDEKLNSE